MFGQDKSLRRHDQSVRRGDDIDQTFTPANVEPAVVVDALFVRAFAAIEDALDIASSNSWPKCSRKLAIGPQNASPNGQIVIPWLANRAIR